jgi:hypothetical protein
MKADDMRASTRQVNVAMVSSSVPERYQLDRESVSDPPGATQHKGKTVSRFWKFSEKSQ